MTLRIRSDKTVILSYFSFVILFGASLLKLPFSWKGPEPLAWIDALFTSTSAVCVTGLASVDTALYTRFGQAIVALLIQTGGLGIIAFATLYVVIPRKRISLLNRGIIKDFYVDEVEHRPRLIIRDILLLTVAIELIGASLLYIRFSRYEDAVFISLFHAISAFCNAGFSTFSTNLEGFVTDPIVNYTIAGLITLGGIGFIVMRDVGNRIAGRKQHLSHHSKIVLLMSFLLLSIGAVAFYFLETNGSMKNMTIFQRITASIFQSVTPRTAGFDTIPQNTLTQGSVLLTLLLMFIGASPASTGGGIKTTTFFIILLAGFRDLDPKDKINLHGRSISARRVIKAFSIAVKGLAIVFVSVILLLLTESSGNRPNQLIGIVFEVISAFGTVGLSLGLTAGLSVAGKTVIILTMFAGRVGLFAMSLPRPAKAVEHFAELPSTDLLIG
ncbi:MAG: TrkH family potassium uptake protein [Rectinemataceae bacterium]|nr:TrkH family potassium uptake protein [Rectinemataceae bacterium]